MIVFWAGTKIIIYRNKVYFENFNQISRPANRQQRKQPSLAIMIWTQIALSRGHGPTVPFNLKQAL